MIRDVNAVKLRVVFGTSCETRDGTSLSDHLLIDPKLQQDLPLMIVRWRQGHYVHTEIARMFWKILVDPAISMDAAITEKIAAEAGQPVLYVDCMGKLSHRYLN